MDKIKKTWEIKLAKWVGSKEHGHRFVGARPYRHGSYLSAEQLPKEVFEFCSLKKLNTFHVVEGYDDNKTFLIEKIEITKAVKPFAYIIYEEMLKELLVNLSNGRNDKCWPLGSFGWKDADLEDSGCTGIKSIVGYSGKSIILEVGGHKTVSDPGQECELTKKESKPFSDCAYEIVCDMGGDGDWTGDDWSLHFTEYIKVPVVPDENGQIAYKKTAERIVRAAKKACKPHQDRWCEMCKYLDQNYAELTEAEEAKRVRLAKNKARRAACKAS